ncbi:MAG: dihydrofolate reductase family protein [Melioribacteraceae bacterium]
MGKISVFNFVSVDGFFAGPDGEIDWFKTAAIDEEWNNYSHKQATADNSTLIFGRTTYEMMKNYWPTAEAIKNDPSMANVLNNSRKIVFSTTLKSTGEGLNWKNITLLQRIDPEEISKLKKNEDMTILGSGSIVQQFLNLDLIDEYSLVIAPIILGAGKLFFKNVKRKDLKLVETKAFRNGIVFIKYQPNRKRA